MTNEESIKRLNKIKAIYKGMDNKSDVKALDMAIKALEQQTDGDLISRQAVLDTISDVMPIYSDNYHYILEQRVKDLPSADNTAEWVLKDGIYGVAYCSKCDYELHTDDTNYCPNCGRRMLGEKNRMTNQECDNNHDCEHCNWTECPLEVEKEREEEE